MRKTFIAICLILVVLSPIFSAPTSQGCIIELYTPGYLVVGFSSVFVSDSQKPQDISANGLELTTQSGNTKSATAYVYYINHLSPTMDFRVTMDAYPMVNSSNSSLKGYGVTVGDQVLYMNGKTVMEPQQNDTADTVYPLVVNVEKDVRSIFSSASQRTDTCRKVVITTTVDGPFEGTYRGKIKVTGTVT